jgi:hypothetical protein
LKEGYERENKRDIKKFSQDLSLYLPYSLENKMVQKNPQERKRVTE